MIFDHTTSSDKYPFNICKNSYAENIHSKHKFKVSTSKATLFI